MRTKINSINLFFNLLSKESQLHKDEIKFMKKQINLMNISPQGFFSSIERREKGGPVTKGKPYLVGEKGKEVYVPSPYFEASIGREDARNLKSNIVTESFFDTGKGRSSDSYEIKSSDGKVLFSDKVEMIGSAMKESSYDHYSDTETFDDGSGETFTETVNMSSRSLDIGVPDLIEHKDQLLGEIHKIEGFENVTIEDVVQGKTGLDDNTLFNILANSDASYATAAKRDAATKADLEARGIKPGEGSSTYGTNVTDIMSDDIMDETSKSLRGTMGYRSGQMNPASLANFSSELEEKSELYFNSEGVQPSKEESNQFASLASSINQSVNSGGVRTVIQPVVETKVRQVSQPVPIPSPSNNVNVSTVSKFNLPTDIAKMIS